MQRLVALLGFAVLVSLAAAPLAQAQVPPGPTLRVQVVDLPAGPTVFEADSTNTLGPFKVRLEGEQFVCPPNTAVTVDVTAEASASGVALNVTPAQLTFTLGGAYTNQTKLSLQQDVSIEVAVAADAAAAENATLDVTAAAGTIACQPSPTVSRGASTATFDIEAEAVTDPPTDDGSDPPSNNTTVPAKKKSGGLPGLEAPAVALALAGAAAVAARRRRGEE